MSDLVVALRYGINLHSTYITFKLLKIFLHEVQFYLLRRRMTAQS
jgi:hypothetical protein